MSAVLLGCASQPPPLPAVRPETMPGAWMDLLAAAPCPDALQARVHMRLDAPGQPGVNLDGTLKVAPSGVLKLDGRLGVFRPIFNLIATGDEAQLLLHEERAFWVTPRGEADWAGMNPSAWASAVGWALCPSRLLQSLEPGEPGRVEGSDWIVRGALRGESIAVEVRIDRRNRALREIRLVASDGVEVGAELEGYRYLGEAWIPTAFTLALPHPEGTLRLRATLSGLGAPDPEVLRSIGILRPPGWMELEAPIPLPVPREHVEPGHRAPPRP